MQSIGNEDDGYWLLPIKCDVDARRLARVPLLRQNTVRPVIVSDRQRGVVRILDAKLSRELCAAPTSPPAVHSDFTAPSFSKTTASEPSHLNTCMTLLVVEVPAGGAPPAGTSSTSCNEVWTGWASGHIAVYSLSQAITGRGHQVKFDAVSNMFAHRGAVHVLATSVHEQTRRFVFSASYDCNVLQFDASTKHVIRSISSACRHRGDFPTSMVKGMNCSLRGLCVRRDSGHEGFTTQHDVMYLSMDNRSHYLIAVGGDDDQNDVAVQLLTASRASCKVVLGIEGCAPPHHHGGRSCGGPVLCTGDEDGVVFFLPLLVSTPAEYSHHSPQQRSPKSDGVTNGQYLVYLANMYSGIRGSASTSQYEIALHKGPIVDAALVASQANPDDSSVSHALIVACSKSCIAGCRVVVASHGGITLCCPTFAISSPCPIWHIASPFETTRPWSDSPPTGVDPAHGGGDGVFYLCGTDGTCTAFISPPQVETRMPSDQSTTNQKDGSVSLGASSQLRLREVVDMVQRSKLMAIAADAALEKQLEISNQLLRDQNVLQEQCTRLTAALELKTTELAEQSATRTSADAVKASLQSKITILEDDNALLRLELQKAGEHVAMLRKRLESGDEGQTIANARIDDLLKQLQRRDDDMKNVLREKDSTGNSLAERVGENKILASNVMNLERKLARLEEEIRGYEQRRQRDQRIIDDQQMIVEELRGKTLHAQSEASTLRGKLTDAELSLQLARAKQQSVRDILVKQGIIDPQQQNNFSASNRRQVVSNGAAPQTTDAFNLDSLLASSVRPTSEQHRQVVSQGVSPLSLIHIYPPTDLQQPAKEIHVALEAATKQ